MAPPNPHPFWLQPISLSVRKGMTHSERKKIYITNSASFCLIPLGPVFIVLNLLQGHFQLVFINIASTLLGLTCLFLNWRRFHRTTPILLTAGGCIIFFLSGLLFRNGMEYTLLISILGAVFMFDSFFTRALLGAANGSAFLLVKVLHFDPAVPGQMPLGRYGINILIFLLCYYWILEIIRSVNNNYLREIEQKNADLAHSQQQLDEEHAKLMARTSELKVANIAKEKLFSIVAHDLRGPIGNLRNTVDLLEDGDLSRADFQAVLGDLKTEVDHTYECLDTLLAWSASQLRAIRPIFTTVPLAVIAQSCVALLADTALRKKITIQNTIPTQAQVWADENQISAIFRNLISNALKFTPAGGSVKIYAVEESGFWRVMVSDTGVGMPQEKARHLFEPNSVNSTFGTLNEKGLGLGLQICHEFVQSNGGMLSVDSREGYGSTFHFTLPSLPMSQSVNQLP